MGAYEYETEVIIPPDTDVPTWPGDSKLEVSDMTQTSVKLFYPPAEDNIGVEGYKVYVNGTEHTTVTGSVYHSADGIYEQTITGLLAGTRYDFIVTAYDDAGNESIGLGASETTGNEIGDDGDNTEDTGGDDDNTGDTGGDGNNTGDTGSSGAGGTPNANVKADAITESVVKVNGVEVRPSITNSGLSVQATDVNATDMKVNLNRAAWKQLADNPSGDIQIAVRGANYTLPIGALQVDAALSQLGVAPGDDYEIIISIQAKDNERARRIAGQRNISILGSSIEFTVSIVANNKQAELNQFNSYVNRQIELPDGVNADQVSTAVVVEDSSLRHVPTRFVQNNGKWYASINSLTNSEYVLIHTDVSLDNVTFLIGRSVLLKRWAHVKS